MVAPERTRAHYTLNSTPPLFDDNTDDPRFSGNRWQNLGEPAGTALKDCQWRCLSGITLSMTGKTNAKNQVTSPHILGSDEKWEDIMKYIDIVSDPLFTWNKQGLFSHLIHEALSDWSAAPND